MDPIELNDPEAIEALLGKISLHGRGFRTDCLLADVYDAGLTYPDFFKAHGSDPDARYGDQSPAWATYHVRQGKKVFLVYSETGRDRRIHTTDTP
jgi:hypothetical protein